MKRILEAIKDWGPLSLVIVLAIVAAYVSISIGRNPSTDSSAGQAARVESDAEGDTATESSYYATNPDSSYGFSGGSSQYPFENESDSTVPFDWASLLNTQAPSNLSAGTAVPGPDSVFVFTGRGRAHGVGLCMDGVLYRAQDGHSYADIIHYYYTGVQISTVDDNQPIRVKCRDGQVRTYSLHDYLLGLAEEPESYPPEGLKVLAVAARTYTLSCIARGKHAGQGYDVCSSGGCCQAFNENKDIPKFPNHNAAVNETAGQVITYDGAPIIAAYCGSCGGHTDSYEDVWGGQSVPYLRGKPDPYCSRSPRFSTTVEISVADLTKKLKASGSTNVGTLELIDLSDRTPGGRVRNARLVGSSGTKSVPGRELSNLLGLPSTLFDYTFR